MLTSEIVHIEDILAAARLVCVSNMSIERSAVELGCCPITVFNRLQAFNRIIAEGSVRLREWPPGSQAPEPEPVKQRKAESALRRWQRPEEQAKMRQAARDRHLDVDEHAKVAKQLAAVRETREPGWQSKCRKLTAEDEAAIRAAVAAGTARHVVAKRWRVSPARVTRINRGLRPGGARRA